MEVEETTAWDLFLRLPAGDDGRDQGQATDAASWLGYACLPISCFYGLEFAIATNKNTIK